MSLFDQINILLEIFFKVAGGNGAGTAANQTYSPWGVYVDVNGTLFVVEYSAHRVFEMA